MTRFTLSAFLALTLASSLSAQVEYDIPDSLAYLKLPRDPAEFVRQVRRLEHLPGLMLEMGCPSDNAWVAAVADGLEEAMDADGTLRTGFAIVWRHAMGRCPEDRSRFEKWLLGWLRKDYAAMLEGRINATSSMLSALAFSTNPEVYELTRDMTLDTRLPRYTRERAASIARRGGLICGEHNLENFMGWRRCDEG